MEKITTEYYQSTEPNTNPNGNGTPAMLKVEIGEKEVRMVVTIESGSAMNGAGDTIIISDNTIARAYWDNWKSVITANAKKIG